VPKSGEDFSGGHEGVTGSELVGVSCQGPDTCFAVGGSFNSSGNSHTLSENWNGDSWSVESSANEHPGQENTLEGID
jgi:hypothetical protein